MYVAMTVYRALVMFGVSWCALCSSIASSARFAVAGSRAKFIYVDLDESGNRDLVGASAGGDGANREHPYVGAIHSFPVLKVFSRGRLVVDDFWGILEERAPPAQPRGLSATGEARDLATTTQDRHESSTRTLSRAEMMQIRIHELESILFGVDRVRPRS